MLNNMCLEERAFYRAISGLHASINIHLCANYLLSNKNGLSLTDPKGEWGPNLEEFKKRFSPEFTSGEGPNWLRNLYFVYLVELRAVAKAAPYLVREGYYTGGFFWQIICLSFNNIIFAYVWAVNSINSL